MIQLYNAMVSTCSQKVRMVLWEKELPWQDKAIVFQKNNHLSDWYLAINPNGVVPALVHDGKTIIDSSVIIEYLEDVFPEHLCDRKTRPRSRICGRGGNSSMKCLPAPSVTPHSMPRSSISGRR